MNVCWDTRYTVVWMLVFQPGKMSRQVTQACDVRCQGWVTSCKVSRTPRVRHTLCYLPCVLIVAMNKVMYPPCKLSRCAAGLV